MKVRLSIIVSIILVTLGLLILITYRSVFQEGGLVLFEYIALSVILVFAIFLLIIWLKGEIGRPTTELMKSMEQLREGNYDYTVDYDGLSKVSLMIAEYEKLRVKLKDDAEHKEKFLSESKELITNLSHDLKTPLTAIKGYTEGIIDGVVASPEQQKRYIRTIYNKACDMEELLEELSYYVKVDANKIEYNFEVHNVAGLYAGCIEDVGFDLAAEDVDFESETDVASDVYVLADIEKLKRVIRNLVSNAIKYTDKPVRKIIIRFLDDRDFIKIEVEDNGIGIAEKDIPYLFNRFYRTDASRNSATGGNGIGLSICKKIIQDHGGYIWAKSKEGEGSTFTFALRKYEVNTNE